MNSAKQLWLAPLRGVTVRSFRKVFGPAIREAGFSGAYAPFIPVNAGFRNSRRMFADIAPSRNGGDNDCGIELVPQAIGKDPAALREWCKAVKDLGFKRADLNAGCPFPMIRRKGRGSGLLRNPYTLERMLEAGCNEMGDGNFSLKTRLGVEGTGELLALMPAINRYPLAAIAIHARTARQMYGGEPDREAFKAAAAAAKIPVIYNGDAGVADKTSGCGLMVGRNFIRGLADRPDSLELLERYADECMSVLAGETQVIGRLKELLSYWCERPSWRRRWPAVKTSRTLRELAAACGAERRLV